MKLSPGSKNEDTEVERVSITGGIYTNNQSGGVNTINTTNIYHRLPPREITCEQMQEFAKAASFPAGLTSDVQIRVANSTNEEAVRYSGKLQMMISSSLGWNPLNFGYSSNVLDPFYGIILNVVDPLNLTTPESFLIDGLNSANIPHIVSRWPNNVSPNMMPRILVGSQP